MSSCGNDITVRRNSDLRVRYIPVGRNFTFDGMWPMLNIRQGPVTVLQISVIPTVNGSSFSIVDGMAVLRLMHLDTNDLVAGSPLDQSVSFSYDIVFRDPTGFENYIVGGELEVLSINDDGSCGVCDSNAIQVSIGGQCYQVEISGNSIGMVGDAPSDGLTYARRSGAWVAIASGQNPPFTVGFSVSPALDPDEVLFRLPFAESVAFPPNFAESVVSIFANPATESTYLVTRNNVVVAALTIEPSGVWSFTPATGADVVYGPNDYMEFRASSAVSSDIIFSVTLKGAR